MTQKEFETRTGVPVTETEFWSINDVYNNSNVDKDEFCRLWKKMNPVRVATANAARTAEEKRMQEMEKAMDIVSRSCSFDYDAMNSVYRSFEYGHSFCIIPCIRSFLELLECDCLDFLRAARNE